MGMTISGTDLPGTTSNCNSVNIDSLVTNTKGGLKTGSQERPTRMPGSKSCEANAGTSHFIKQKASESSDYRNHQLALLATCLIGFSLFLNLYFTQIILGPVAEVFGTTVLQARYTMVAATAGVVFAPFFANRLRQRKAIQVATLAAMTVIAGIEAAAPGLWALIGIRFCQGILVGVLFIQAMGRIASIHRVRFGALSNALFVSSTTLGGFTSRFLPPTLVDALGVKATFLVLASVLLLICAAVQLSPMPEASADVSRESEASAGSASGQRRAFVVEYLLGFCVLFSQASIYTYLPVRLAHAPFYLDNRHIAFMAFVFLLGAISAPLTIRATRNDLSRFAISLFFGCVAVGALLTGTTNLYAVAAGLALFSIGAFALQAMLSRRLTARAGASTPRIFAVYMSIYYLGGSIGSYISGNLLVSRGFSGVVLIVVSAAALGGTALYLRDASRPTLRWRSATTGRPLFNSKPGKYESEP
jgi:MFS transporter, YNFM family, putative membrane transport protein